MRRSQTICVGFALVACAFLLGWVVAGLSGGSPDPAARNPYGSARVLELPGTLKPVEPRVMPPKTPPPVTVLPKKLGEYRECLRTNGAPSRVAPPWGEDRVIPCSASPAPACLDGCVGGLD